MKFSKLILLVLVSLLIAGCATKIPKSALQLSPESLETREMQTRMYDTSNEMNILSASTQVLQDIGFNLDESEVKLGVIVGSKTRDATDGGQVAAAVALALFTGAVMHVDKNQIIRASLVTRPLQVKNSVAEKISEKLQKKIVRKISDKTRMVINKELEDGLSDKIAKDIIIDITNDMAKEFSKDFSNTLKEKLKEGRIAVRVTFQRIVYNTANQITKQEAVSNPELYKEFFEKLSKSVFLEAHTI